MPGAVLLPALHNDGTGGFSKSRLHEAHSDYREIRAADFTGDGLPEIVATSFGSRAVVFLENLGSRFVSGDVDTSVQSALSPSVGESAARRHIPLRHVGTSPAIVEPVDPVNGGTGYATNRTYRTGRMTSRPSVVMIQAEFARSRSNPYTTGGTSALNATGITDTMTSTLNGTPPARC